MSGICSRHQGHDPDCRLCNYDPEKDIRDPRPPCNSPHGTHQPDCLKCQRMLADHEAFKGMLEMFSWELASKVAMVRGAVEGSPLHTRILTGIRKAMWE